MMVDIGEIYETNNCGKLEIINYINSHNVLVSFVETGFRIVAESGQIKRGAVTDKLFPLTYGIGYEGVGEFSFKKNREASTCWTNMLRRCYSKKSHDEHPMYKNCSVCKYWHNFQNFAKWYYENYIKGFHLDKDLYIEGNKEYGPLTCTFVRRDVNSLFTNKKCTNNKLPIGVRENLNKNKYRSQCNINGETINGTFRKSVYFAEFDYLKMREKYILDDIMTRKDFPERLLFPFWLRVKTMQNKIKLLKLELKNEQQ